MMDHDFVDVSTMEANPQETLETEDEPAEEEVAVATRGKYVKQEELVHFENNHQFQGSNVKAEIDEFMGKRKSRKRFGLLIKVIVVNCRTPDFP